MQYSGLVIFAAKLLSVVTGLIFQYIIAHALNEVEYGLWFNITDVTNYFILMAGVVPFWTMRYVTRDREGAIKTGVFANLGISGAATVIYLLLIPTATTALHIPTAYLPMYLLASVQIVELYSINVLEACLQARAPRTVGYGLLIQQVIKVALVYVLIIELHQLLLGALVATLVAFAIQIFYYFKLLARELVKRFRREYIGQWFKGSLANIYTVAGNQLAAYIFILLFAFGGEGARGIFGAAATVVNVITYSSFLSFAMYPKLLADKNCEDATSCMKMVLMFAIPLTVGAIVYADTYIIVLRPEAAGAGLVLMILAADAFISVISGFYSSVLYGFETVDEGATLTLRQLIKSKLFIAFSLPYIHSAFTLPTTYYILTTYAQNQPIQAALYVSIINSVGHLAMFIVLFFVVRGMISVCIPWKNITKYLLAAAAMALTLYLVPHPTNAPLTVFQTFLVLVVTAVGGLIYIGVLFAVDKEARKLPRDLIKEIRRR